MKSKEWRAVVGYEGTYEVSDHGDIRRIDNHPQSLCFRKKRVKHLSDASNAEGYRHVTLCRDGVTKTFGVHLLVARAFHGPPAPREECAHLDGNPPNCRATNLKWVTRRVNHHHKRAHGTHRCGEQIKHIAKLNARKVKKIMELKDTASEAAIGRMFGVSQTAVNHIYHGRTWMHVTGLSAGAKHQSAA